MEHQYQPQLLMVLDSLADLPPVALPDGYMVRSYRQGDEQAWEAIIAESFNMEADFDKQMKQDSEYRPERIMFVCHGEQPVATASAWYRGDFPADTGYLHMVGNLTAHYGKRLGLSVSLAAMYRMKEEGRAKAVLNTDDFRIPAIKTYLKLGYMPKLVHDNQVPRWNDIAGKLGRPELAAVIPGRDKE